MDFRSRVDARLLTITHIMINGNMYCYRSIRHSRRLYYVFRALVPANIDILTGNAVRNTTQNIKVRLHYLYTSYYCRYFVCKNEFCQDFFCHRSLHQGGCCLRRASARPPVWMRVSTTKDGTENNSSYAGRLWATRRSIRGAQSTARRGRIMTLILRMSN